MDLSFQGISTAQQPKTKNLRRKTENKEQRETEAKCREMELGLRTRARRRKGLLGKDVVYVSLADVPKFLIQKTRTAGVYGPGRIGLVSGFLFRLYNIPPPASDLGARLPFVFI